MHKQQFQTTNDFIMGAGDRLQDLHESFQSVEGDWIFEHGIQLGKLEECSSLWGEPEKIYPEIEKVQNVLIKIGDTLIQAPLDYAPKIACDHFEIESELLESLNKIPNRKEQPEKWAAFDKAMSELKAIAPIFSMQPIVDNSVLEVIPVDFIEIL